MIVISTRNACFGVVLVNNRVNQTPPIAAYMMGWTALKVIGYARYRGWKAQYFK